MLETKRFGVPTHYNGQWFRSKLEVKWAMYFNQKGILYEYEPRRFYCNNIAYTPDFLIKDPRFETDFFAEVKPSVDFFIEETLWKVYGMVSVGMAKELSAIIVCCDDPLTIRGRIWIYDIVNQLRKEYSTQDYYYRRCNLFTNA